MRYWPLVPVALVWLAAGFRSTGGEEWVVVVGGDTNGYLSPCGCTKPMIGGIRKRVAMIRSLTNGQKSLVLENGGLIAGQGRQDELKAEAMAQSLKAAGADAITFGYTEARFGQGMQVLLNQLSGGKLINTALQESPTNEVRPFAEKGPFLVGALDVRTSSVAGSLMERTLSAEAAVRRLVQEAERSGLAPVLMLQGTRRDAEGLARSEPKLRMIVFRSDGNATESPEMVGGTWLVSPGGSGLYLLRLSFSGNAFRELRSIRVEATIRNDPDASRYFKDYLRQVESEGLLNRAPRAAGPAYAGTKACGSCHSKALEIWNRSRHAAALRSLDKVGQAKDPECVPCHVVGLSEKSGFVSREKTPQLASVGCEGCHGPGAAHAQQPSVVRLRKADGDTCLRCHKPEHSPGFDFPKFWKSIAHK